MHSIATLSSDRLAGEVTETTLIGWAVARRLRSNGHSSTSPLETWRTRRREEAAAVGRLIERHSRPEVEDVTNDAPNITTDTAFYQPELKGRHVVLVTADEVRRIGDLIAAFTGAAPRCMVLFGDGYMRTMSVEKYCADDNPPRRRIRSVEIEASQAVDDGSVGRSAKVRISDVGADNVEIELFGSPETVETLRQALEDRVASMTPSYSWFARRDPSWVLIIAFFGITVSLDAEAWGSALAFLFLGILVLVGKRFVPRTAFGIGQGAKRVETAKTMRHAVFVALVINLLGGVLLGAVVGF